MRRSWLLAAFVVPTTLAAQRFQFMPQLQPELRTDAMAARESAVLAGIGANVPAGYYVRVAFSAEAGTTLGNRSQPIGRAEVVARFLTDPFRQLRWNAYAGGGLALVAEGKSRGHAVLVLVTGVEFPGAVGWRPSVELGAGGGLRAGVVLKPARRVGR